MWKINGLSEYFRGTLHSNDVKLPNLSLRTRPHVSGNFPLLFRIRLASTRTCITKQRKWRQHTILRMFNKQNPCKKHWAKECIRIHVESEKASKTIGIRYLWTRIFLIPKKKIADTKISGYVWRGLRQQREHRDVKLFSIFTLKSLVRNFVLGYFAYVLQRQREIRKSSWSVLVFLLTVMDFSLLFTHCTKPTINRL